MKEEGLEDVVRTPEAKLIEDLIRCELDEPSSELLPLWLKHEGTGENRSYRVLKSKHRGLRVNAIRDARN